MPERFLQSIFKGSKLRNRFIFVTVFLAGLPVVVLGTTTFFIIDKSHRYDVSLMEQQLILQKVEEVKKFLADTLNILELRIGLAEKTEISLSDQDFILEGFLRENLAFEQVSFVSLLGQETSKKTRPGKDVSLNEISSQLYFQEAKKGRRFIGESVSSDAGPFIIISAPVRNRLGDIIQVLVAKANLLEIANSIKSARLGNKGYLILVDNKGNLISQGAKESLAPDANLTSFWRIKEVLSGKIFDGLGKKDRYRSQLSDEFVVGAGRQIQDTNWAILAEWPISDADAVLRHTRIQVIMIFILAILFAILVIPIFVARLVAPIRQLKAAAKEVEKGNFEQKVDIDTNDELEELGESFNKMVQGLKRLRELQNEFVFVASHELRNPSAAIKWAVEAALEEKKAGLSKYLQNSFNIIQESSERLNRLVDELLTLARTEAGKLKIEVGPCDIRKTVNKALLAVQALSKDKKISVFYDEPKELPQVLADCQGLEQAIVNFITNGIKYNNKGGYVKVSHEQKEGRLITHIEDNGIGIGEEDQKHIFEKFFRAETGRRFVAEGTGLGLFITKELIERMSGQVWFISEKDKGSKFSFSLPLAKGNQ